MPRKLSDKQQRFIDAYCGNATDAARKAGYKGNDVTLRAVGRENLAKPYIHKAIREREEARREPLIADRKARQTFWTETMQDSDGDMKDRLKASELLGRSEADFTERHEHSGPDNGPIQTITRRIVDPRADD